MKKKLLIVTLCLSILSGCASNRPKNTVVATGDVNLGGEAFLLELALADGEYFYNKEVGPFQGENWVGQFTLYLYREEDRRLMSSYDLEAGEMTFGQKFQIMTKDYNEDGTVEFLIGQYGSANYNVYTMYYIDPELQMGTYPQIGEILMSDTSMSPLLGPDGSYRYYDNSTGETIEKKVEFSDQSEEKTATKEKAPSKEEVLAMREKVLSGMSDEEIKRLRTNVKDFNLEIEEKYLYDNIFEKLEDSTSPYWQYFDAKGEINLGTDGFGEPIIEYNRFDAASFIALFGEMKESVNDEVLKADIQVLMDETQLAADTHDMEHANNIYKILHDMDYFLLRYGPEDVGKYTQDASIVGKYYGVLRVYSE